jgi:hypothetical protein
MIDKTNFSIKTCLKNLFLSSKVSKRYCKGSSVISSASSAFFKSLSVKYISIISAALD